MRIQVRTVNDSLPDFEYLFGLWNQLRETPDHVTLDFSNCQFLQQNAVAFLGGLARLIASRSGAVSFDWTTLRGNVRANLERNGFLAAFGGSEQPCADNAIPYREDANPDEKQIAAYLRDRWLGRGWISVGPRLCAEIVSRVVELYDNAFTHARTPVGVISCGQYYPTLKRLKLTAVDFGVGIPATVRAYLGKPAMPPGEAMAWALRRGTTTKRGSISRGLGLDLLKTFVQMNKGSLEIFSGGGYALITEDVERCVDRGLAFGGTLVNISLRCDERYYHLGPEPTDGPLF